MCYLPSHPSSLNVFIVHASFIAYHSSIHLSLNYSTLIRLFIYFALIHLFIPSITMVTDFCRRLQREACSVPYHAPVQGEGRGRHGTGG